MGKKFRKLNFGCKVVVTIALLNFILLSNCQETDAMPLDQGHETGCIFGNCEWGCDECEPDGDNCKVCNKEYGLNGEGDVILARRRTALPVMIITEFAKNVKGLFTSKK